MSSNGIEVEGGEEASVEEEDKVQDVEDQAQETATSVVPVDQQANDDDYPVWWSVENNITIKRSEWGGLLPGKKDRKEEFSWEALARVGRFYRPSSKAKSAVNNDIISYRTMRIIRTIVIM